GGYGYEWDSLGDPSLIAPIRRVYPHNGFRILLAAFAQALRDETPLEAAPFVASYARERFGLSSADGDRLWRALNHDATPMAAGTPIEPALRSITAARRLFQRLRPIRHQTEFAHLKLMIDLRHHHLRFKKIERAVNSSLFRARQAARYSLQLGGLLREARNLDRRYAALQTGFLQREEIAEDMAYRSRKLRLLHARLARTSRA
ncbi:MAG: glycoside hydrolase family 20, partial [Opitutaceae bacterium]|nr:glycoside hydrolase family 20 [Opitutaceae bacterium]